jgi:hypothetical protein
MAARPRKNNVKVPNLYPYLAERLIKSIGDISTLSLVNFTASVLTRLKQQRLPSKLMHDSLSSEPGKYWQLVTRLPPARGKQ